MESYRYKALDLSQEAIRVLRLHKSPWFDAQVHIEVIQTTIGHIPYEALSYTWGTMEKPCSISLDYYNLPVTRNVYVALQHLRLPYEDRFLWIDAISINQDDVKERGHQVGQMKLIYEHAERVLIWLGESDAEIDDLFRVISPLSNLCGSFLSVNGHYTSTEVINGCALKPYHRDVFLGILHRNWFNRVWILQEVASARAAVVFCGRNSISTRIFTRLPLLFDITPPAASQAVLDIMPGQSRNQSWWAAQRDLSTLLDKFSSSQATDHRDKVFALLGICSDREYASLFIDLNYDSPEEQVAQDVMEYELCHELGVQPIISRMQARLVSLPRPKIKSTFWEDMQRFVLEICLRVSGANNGGNIEMTRATLIELSSCLCQPRNRNRFDGMAHLCSLKENLVSDEIFRDLLRNNELDWSIPDADGVTVMHRAVTCWKDEDVHMMFCRRDDEINQPDKHGITPLLLAFIMDRSSIVEELTQREGIEFDLNLRIPILYGSYVAGDFRNVFQISFPWSKASLSLLQNSLLDKEVAETLACLAKRDERELTRIGKYQLQVEICELPDSSGFTVDSTQVNMKNIIKPLAFATLKALRGKLEWVEETDESILDIAIAIGALPKLEFILELSHRRRHVFEIGKSLMRAVRAGQIEVVRILLSYHSRTSPADTIGGHRRRAMQIATRLGHREMMNLLSDGQDWGSNFEDSHLSWLRWLSRSTWHSWLICSNWSRWMSWSSCSSLLSLGLRIWEVFATSSRWTDSSDHWTQIVRLHPLLPYEHPGEQG